MDLLRSNVIGRQTIAGMLSVTVLVVTLLPSHYHVHHFNGNGHADHTHVMDLHVAADHRNYDHHDEDISIISATPDAIVNQVKMLLFVFAPLVVLLATLTLRSDHTGFGVPDVNAQQVRHLAFFTPLLRAPPIYH